MLQGTPEKRRPKKADWQDRAQNSHNGRVPVLFLACSSFSGSTLLSFLLNTHPDIATVGHTIGWRYSTGDVFHCSCGATLESCPFWTRLAEAFRDAGLPFSFREFGTRFQIVQNERLNRYLTAQILRFSSDALESLRDRLVRAVPHWAQTLDRQGRANVTLMRTALDYAGAKVYVDNTHSPYRLRNLSRVVDLDLSIVYLVRDIRATVNSYMKNHGWGVRSATRIWLNEQENILRIGRGFERMLTVTYEDLCDATEQTLTGIHEFAGVDPIPYTGDFGGVEHHILGNVMRFGQMKIVKDEMWRTRLKREEIHYIEDVARNHIARHPDEPLSGILRRQLDAS